MRTPEYDAKEVVEMAARYFRQHGFTGAKMSGLVAATGLNRHSMYQLFGNKMGLYEAALSYHLRTEAGFALEPIESGALGMSALYWYFNRYIHQLTDPAEPRACLFVNSLLEQQRLSESCREMTRTHERRLLSALEASVAAAIQGGDFAQWKGREAALAKILLSLSNALAVRVAAAASAEELFRLVEQQLLSLAA